MLRMCEAILFFFSYSTEIKYRELFEKSAVIIYKRPRYFFQAFMAGLFIIYTRIISPRG